MKRVIAIIVMLLLMIPLIPAAYAAESPAVTSNIDEHWYTNAQRWAHPIESTLRAEGDGYLRVEYTGSTIVIEQYDSDFQFVSGRELDLELPIYGGVYLCDDYNFVLVGQTNPQEDDNCEVFRIIRYSKDWVRQDSASLYGVNTVEPFRAGSARFDRCEGMLYIRTSHKMYAADDGLNHQANVMMAIRISDMTVTDQYTVVMNKNYGYVSHSFNQFVRVDGTTLLAVDHGDAYPRSVVLTKYPYSAAGEYFSGRVTYVETFPIAGSIGANDTGVSVGGFEFSSTHYLIAGNSTEQLDTTAFMYAYRNIFVTATPKDSFTSDANVIRWITAYTQEDDVSVSPPHLVKIGSDRFLLIWTENNVLTYCFLNGKGEVEGETYRASGALSDCVPILAENRIVWYVTDYSEPVFYIIDLSEPGKVTNPHKHTYTAAVTAPTCTEGGYTTYTCSQCGHSYVGNRTDALQHSWQDASCTLPKTCSRCAVTEGEPLGHDYGEWIVEKEATCTESGSSYALCSRCDSRAISVTAALGHKMVVQLVEPTCTEQGYETSFCDRCDYHGEYTYTDPLGHDFCDWHRVKEPNCTAKGSEERICFRCGYTNKRDIDAIGHDYADGICTRCGAEKPALEGVIRLSGKNRYQTAFAVADQLKELMGVDKFDAVVVAYGQNFPDALTGSYLAKVKNAPILLTEASADSTVLDYIKANLKTGGEVYILGGTAAVSQYFEDEAKAAGFEVVRLKGKNRYDTNLAILREAGVNADDEILIATGKNYADSLSASATGLPMLLVDKTLNADQIEFLKTTSGKFVIIGGTGAVGQEIQDQLNALGTAIRVKGANRYATSVEIAMRYFGNPEAAVLAYAQGFPDGLCGGPLAIRLGAPLVLTSNESPVAADAYIEGISIGAVTGGTGRISDETVRAIFDLAQDTEIPKK